MDKINPILMKIILLTNMTQNLNILNTEEED